jgi:GT2 family glycosyltransferase
MNQIMTGDPNQMSEQPQFPKVSIVVVSYNTRDMTLDCLRSIARETGISHEVIVIDNASADGSAAAIAAEFPKVVLLAESANHGFAGANNIAAERAQGEYLLLLNPDTVILEQAIDRLVAFAEKQPQAKIWGGRTLYGDGSLNRTSCFQAMSLWNVFCRASGLASLTHNHRFFSETYGGWDMQGERVVDIVTGCFFLLKTRLWRDLEGFNPTYFMYGEEADLCLRAKERHGANPMVTSDAVITHYGGASEPVRADKAVRQYSAKITLIRHHFGAWQKPIGLFLFRSIPATRAAGLTIVAALSGKASHKNALSEWREVWARRGEWTNGFKEIG